jgi:minor extracellular serine protease Vpr
MSSHHILWRLVSLCAALALIFGSLSSAAAQPSLQGAGNDGGPTTPGGDALQQRLLQQRKLRQQGRSGAPAVDASGVGAMSALGDAVLRVEIELKKPSLASLSDGMTPEQRTAYAAEIAAYQDQAAEQITAVGGQVVYRFRTLSSGLIARVPGRLTPQIARLPQVMRINQIHDYKQDLTQTVPFIGVPAVKIAGYNGAGVKIAILDSGIDYTHQAFGGPGTVAAWQAAYYGASPACISALGRLPGCANDQAPDPTLFGPAAPRVKGGYDWVGATWDGTAPEVPDSNPIANRYNPATGDNGDHGTHVADIIGGNGYTGKGEGVAPGADLYAFTVCSSISSFCSGAAILEALDNAADLDNNPATKDPADVVNLSLGEPYGQPESGDAYIVNQLVSYGSVVVVSAGNEGDKPYIVEGPSSASGSISVAETTVPSSLGYLIESGALSAPYPVSILQNWSGAINADISALLTYDTASNSTRQGCSDVVGTSPWTGTPLTGKVVLMDRGTCAIWQKTTNAQAAGARLALVVNSDPQGLNDLPPSFSGNSTTIPALVITQLDGDRIKAVPALAGGTMSVTVRSTGISLAYSVVSTSSRGPRNHDNMLKPDIAAPGASVSAQAGTGNGATAFGGTSGAAPMVTGVVALMKQSHGDAQNFTHPYMSPQEYKALLINTANNQIYKNGADTGYLAPVSRIGGGQVDAEKALKTDFIAWDSTDADPLKWTGSLSFGYQPVTGVTTLTRKLTIRNLDALSKEFYTVSQFRYPNDENKGVSVSINPVYVVIGGNSTQTVDVTLTIDLSVSAAQLVWPSSFNRGVNGYNGYEMDQVEVDGYLSVVQSLGGKTIHVPWQVLPKAAADISAAQSGPGTVALTNTGLYVNGKTTAFSLLDENPNDWYYTIGDCSSVGLNGGCNLSLVDLKDVGIAYDNKGTPATTDDMLYFGLSVWDSPYRAGQYPVGYNIYLDTNGDGKEDYVIFTADQNQDATDGRSAVFYQSLAAPNLPEVFYGYVIGSFDSNNTIIPLPVSLLGIDPTQALNFYVIALDTYFSDPYMDISPRGRYYHVYTPTQPRYALNPADLNLVAPAGSSVPLAYTELKGTAAFASGSQIGFLFMNSDAPVGKESSVVQLGTPTFYLYGLPVVGR